MRRDSRLDVGGSKAGFEFGRPTSKRADILHELVHVRVPNYGRLLRALVGAHLTGADSRNAQRK
jgi:hypothetical protein